MNFGYVTLHVGSGTYQRLREGDVRDQTLHAERLEVDRLLCDQAAAARAAGARVIAVGTTAVRSLETAARAHDGQSARTRAKPSCSLNRVTFSMRWMRSSPISTNRSRAC